MQGSGGVGGRWGQVGQRSRRLVQRHADDHRRQSHSSLASSFSFVSGSSSKLQVRIIHSAGCCGSKVMSRAICRISSGSTTAHRQGTPSAACRPARAAAIRLAATVSQATSFTLAIALAAMGTTKVLDAFPPRPPWATRVSTGQPR